MKKTNQVAVYLSALIALAVSAFIANAEIIFVPEEFATIQSAVDNSAPSDTVLVRAGPYEESVVVPDWDITIAGEYLLTADTSLISQTRLHPDQVGGSRSIIGLGSNNLSLLNITGITIDGRGFQNSGVAVNRRSLVINNCIFDSCYGINSVLSVQESDIRIMETVFSGCGGSFGGIHGQFLECITRMEDCSFLSSYSTIEGSYEFVIRNGTFEIRGSALRSLGHSNQEPPSFTEVFFSDDSVQSVRIVGNVFEDCLINELIREPRDSLAIAVFDSNLVSNCGIYGYVVANANMSPYSRILMRDNVFVDNTDVPGVAGGQGFFAIGWITPNAVTITGNLFLRNFNRDNSCGLMSGEELHFDISRNYFIENSNNAFVRPPGGAVMLYENSRGQFEYNIFQNNIGYAVNHFAFYPEGYARYNYWNHESGPYHPSLNPFGQGDSVDTLIVFEPWEIDTSFLQDAVSPPQPSIPTDFLIGRVYPNPFNSEIEIEYVVTGTYEVKLTIYDLLGREVCCLVDEQKEIGIHRACWKPAQQSSGIYFAYLHTVDSHQRPSIKKLVYLK